MTVNDELDEKVVRLDRKQKKKAKTDWLDRCLKSDTGKPLPILANALIALRSLMPEIVALDEMLRAPLLMQALEDKADFVPRPVTDVDVGVVQERLQHLGLKRLSKDIVHQAIDIRASECRFHPVQDYLDSLQWDGTARLANLFPKYFGAESTAYTTDVPDQYGRQNFRTGLARQITC